ncbi:MAG: hypothetical protein AB2812_13635 [Candidatus Sedimenticola endophacoides]
MPGGRISSARVPGGGDRFGALHEHSDGAEIDRRDRLFALLVGTPQGAAGADRHAVEGTLLGRIQHGLPS